MSKRWSVFLCFGVFVASIWSGSAQAHGWSQWRGREAENASIVRAGAFLLLGTTNSELIVAKANPARFEEVKRYTVADSAMWAHPAFVGRTILVKDVDKLIAWSF